VREHVLGLVDQHWGFASDVLTEIFASDADAGYRAVFSRYQRESTSAAWARRLLAACYDIDVADDLGRITAPTTVIHRTDDRVVPIAEGERLAAGPRGDLPGGHRSGEVRFGPGSRLGVKVPPRARIVSECLLSRRG
jgi:pimeloyl-ACP methyl ester carboxylesterase